VSWVFRLDKIPITPGSQAAVGGPSWVACIVNAIGNDTTCEDGEGYWSDTAIVITGTIGVAGTTTNARPSWMAFKAITSMVFAYP
jgi:hypothetical protein